MRDTLREHHLATPDTRVLAAVSGGADSVALAYLLAHLHEEGALHLVGLVHVHHHLRADLDADADARHAEAVAQQIGIPCHVAHVDVRARARTRRQSLEAAAHTLRHAAYETARVAHGADVVAVGHTMDDQAETVLLRLLRGAGRRGLSGMHPRRGRVIRPLLHVRRAALRAWLVAEGLTWREDATNDDVRIPRNRVRAELLPHLVDRHNPRVVERLAAWAEMAREEEAWLEAAAQEALAAVRLPSTAASTDRCALDARAVTALPVALRRRVMRLALADVGAGGAGWTDVERAGAVAVGTRRAVDLPGVTVQRNGATLVLMNRRAVRPEPVPNGVEPEALVPFPVPGHVTTASGAVLTAAVLEAPPALRPEGQQAVMLPLARCAAGLFVRTRRPGDRLRPTAAGSRSLQDLFVDRKVPRALRDQVPVVTDANGTIVWVAGVAADVSVRDAVPSGGVVVLSFMGEGGAR